MLGLHVVFAVDRAGLVGEDGETHHGIYDVGFLRHAPGLRILCPGSRRELQEMLRWAVNEQNGPVAIRYPRGGDRGFDESAWNPDMPVVSCKSGKDAAIITYGTMTHNALDAALQLQKQGIDAAVLRLLSIEPIPASQIRQHLPAGVPVIIAEEVGENCGIGQKLAYELPNNPVKCLDLGHQFVQHGAVDVLHTHYGIDADHIAKSVQEVHSHEN